MENKTKPIQFYRAKLIALYTVYILMHLPFILTLILEMPICIFVYIQYGKCFHFSTKILDYNESVIGGYIESCKEIIKRKSPSEIWQVETVEGTKLKITKVIVPPEE